MPFDPTNYIETKPDLSKPSLRGLAWLLRHPEYWHRNYEWDYSLPSNVPLTEAIINKAEPECGSAGCAIGLARLIWGWHECDSHGLAFPFDGNPLQPIFNNMRNDSGGDVTAEIVAQRIDDYIAGRHIPTRKDCDR